MSRLWCGLFRVLCFAIRHAYICIFCLLFVCQLCVCVCAWSLRVMSSAAAPRSRPRSSTMPLRQPGTLPVQSKPRFQNVHHQQQQGEVAASPDSRHAGRSRRDSIPPHSRPAEVPQVPQRPASTSRRSTPSTARRTPPRPPTRGSASEGSPTTPRAGPLRRAASSTGTPTAPSRIPSHGAISKTNRAESPVLAAPRRPTPQNGSSSQRRSAGRATSPPSAPRVVPSRGASTPNSPAKRTPPAVPQRQSFSSHGGSSPEGSRNRREPPPAPAHKPSSHGRAPTPPRAVPLKPHPEHIDRDETPKRDLSKTRGQVTPPGRKSPRHPPSPPSSSINRRAGGGNSQPPQQLQLQPSSGAGNAEPLQEPVPNKGWEAEYYAYMQEKEATEKQQQQQVGAGGGSRALVETTSPAPVQQQKETIEAQHRKEQQAQREEEQRAHRTASSSSQPLQHQRQDSGVIVESSWESAQAESMTYISVILKPSSESSAPPKLFKLTLRGNTDDVTVESIKEALAEFCGLAVDQQRLTKDGTVLTNRMQGIEFGLKAGAVLYLDTLPHAQSPVGKDGSRSASKEPSGQEAQAQSAATSSVKKKEEGETPAPRSASTESERRKKQHRTASSTSEVIARPIFLVDGTKTKSVDEFEFKLDLEAQLEEMRGMELSIARQKEALAQRRRIFSRLQRKREEQLAREEAEKREELRKLRAKRTKSYEGLTYRDSHNDVGPRYSARGRTRWSRGQTREQSHSQEDQQDTYSGSDDDDASYLYEEEEPELVDEDPYRRALGSRGGARVSRQPSYERRAYRHRQPQHQQSPPPSSQAQVLTSPPHLQHSSYKPARRYQDAVGEEDANSGGDYADDNNMVIDLSEEPQLRPFRQPLGPGARRKADSPSRVVYTTHAPLQSPFRD